MANEEYDLFLQKFERKKTTDDCYTPPEIYEVVKSWAVTRNGWEGREIYRPFYPGGDYRYFAYGGVWLLTTRLSQSLRKSLISTTAKALNISFSAPA